MKAAARSQREHAFEGIIPNLERRYKETDSVDRARGIREIPQLADVPRMRGHAAAPRGAPCPGGRSMAIYEINALPLKEAKAFFDQVKLTGHKVRHRRQDRQGNFQPSAISSTTSGSITCRWIARPKPCPAANRSASGLPARSARD